MDGNSTSRRIEQLIDQESSERMTQMNEDSVSRKATEIIACINSRLQSGPDLDGEIQRELGRSINFLTDVALTDTLWLRNRQVLDAIGLSVEAAHLSSNVFLPPYTRARLLTFCYGGSGRIIEELSRRGLRHPEQTCGH